MHKGYDDALNLAKSRLSELTPQNVVENTGVIWDGKNYIIPWYNTFVKLEDGDIEEKIIWYHYLLSQGPKQERGRLINYKQVPGAIIYNDNFIKRAINPMVKTFAKNLDNFLKKGELLGGTKSNLGDMSFVIRPLPYIPLTYVIWLGDDEIPNNGNILFDEAAIEWLCAEDLVVLASLPVYKMMRI